MNWKDAKDTLFAPLVSSARLGIITDFDGTLSSIVDDPNAAGILPESKAALEALASQAALVSVVSGRSAADIHRMTGIEQAVYIGNHGMERWTANGLETPKEVAAYRPNLEGVLSLLEPHYEQGLYVEDKGATASVHYRRTKDPQATAQRLRPVLEDITKQKDMVLHEGKMVFELRPPVDFDKGTAVTKLVQEFDLTAAIYLGDDVTDVPALQTVKAMRDAGSVYGVGISVTHEDTPDIVRNQSDVFADGVDDVASFLDWLSNEVSASST